VRLSICVCNVHMYICIYHDAHPFRAEDAGVLLRALAGLLLGLYTILLSPIVCIRYIAITGGRCNIILRNGVGNDG